MIGNLPFFLEIVGLGTPALLFFMLLPTLVEVKKPEDSGPRPITAALPEEQLILDSEFCLMHNMEGHYRKEFSLNPLAKAALRAMPNLDA